MHASVANPKYFAHPSSSTTTATSTRDRRLGKRSAKVTVEITSWTMNITRIKLFVTMKLVWCLLENEPLKVKIKIVQPHPQHYPAMVFWCVL